MNHSDPHLDEDDECVCMCKDCWNESTEECICPDCSNVTDHHQKVTVRFSQLVALDELINMYVKERFIGKKFEFSVEIASSGNAVIWEKCVQCEKEFSYPYLCLAHRLCSACHPSKEKLNEV